MSWDITLFISTHTSINRRNLEFAAETTLSRSRDPGHDLINLAGLEDRQRVDNYLVVEVKEVTMQSFFRNLVHTHSHVIPFTR